MKIKTAELTGAALDLAVAKCQSVVEGWTKQWVLDDLENGILHSHYDDWANCGPIIEREKIHTFFAGGKWLAEHNVNEGCFIGPTPLVAAMRCFVASKMGDEIDVPEELR